MISMSHCLLHSSVYRKQVGNRRAEVRMFLIWRLNPLNVRNRIIIVTLPSSEHLVGIMPHVDYLLWPFHPPAEGQQPSLNLMGGEAEAQRRVPCPHMPWSVALLDMDRVIRPPGRGDAACRVPVEPPLGRSVTKEKTRTAPKHVHDIHNIHHSTCRLQPKPVCLNG